MSRISLLLLPSLLCCLAVKAEESQEHQLSNSISGLSTLKRDVRSPDSRPKKNKQKHRPRKIAGKGKKKNNQKRPKKASKKGSKKPNNKKGAKNRRKNKKNNNKKKKKSKSRKAKSGRNGKKRTRKIKVIKRKHKPKHRPRKNKERQTGGDDATCLANIGAAMDYEGIQIKNFNNQKKRVEDFDKLIKNKAKKKDNFQNTTSYMKEAIGADNSCNGTTNQEDVQTAVSTHNTLSNCSSSVESVCVVPSGTFNTTELASCQASFTAVTDKNKECYQLTTAAGADLSAACTCWAAAAQLVTTTKALKCSAKDSYDSINTLKKTCKTTFSDCKKAEDASVGLIQVCNGGTTPSTASPSPSSVATTAAPSPAPSPTTAAPSPAPSPTTAAPSPAPYPTTAAPAPAAATTAAPTTAAPAAPTTTAAQADTTTTAAAAAATTASGSKVVWTLKTSPFPQFPKYTTVFGTAIFAVSTVTDAQFQHVASVMAEWIDNDEDGCADNPLVLTKYLAQKPQPSILVPGATSVTNTVGEAFDKAGYYCNAPLFTGEIFPNCSGPAATSACADATLEELLHMWTAAGFSVAYPAAFGIQVSKLTAAMDVARGGKFETPPATYPTSAWFTYDDSTCGYACQVTEYVYWGMSAWVGALVGRKTEINKEWRFETKAKVEAGDALLTALFKNTTVYKVPTISPTGVYKGPSTCATGVNHS